MHLPAKPITFPFACYFFDYDYGNSSGGKITEFSIKADDNTFNRKIIEMTMGIFVCVYWF